jgi:DNA replication protein DnaC
VITSNRTAPQMGEPFDDPLLASAAMDRLRHDAHVLILEGASFRNPGERRKSKKNNNPRLFPQLR